MAPVKNTPFFDLSDEALETQAAELAPVAPTPASSEIPDWLKNMNTQAPETTTVDLPVASVVAITPEVVLPTPKAETKLSKAKNKPNTPKPQVMTQDIVPTLDAKDLPDWLK